MSSTRSSSQSQAASRTYRIRNLRRAHIYIDQLEVHEWPEWTQDFARYLNHEDEHRITQPQSGDSQSSIVQRAVAQAQRNHRNIRRLLASVEPYWMDFSRTHLFSEFWEESAFASCQDQIWNEPVDIIQGELAPLSVPKPDLAFGLAISDSVASQCSVAQQVLQGLDEADLTYLQVHANVHPYPSPAIPDLAFPCLIYECKSDTQPIFFAENQIAGAAAKALRMLEGLKSAAGDTSNNMPVIAICSQGTLWKVFVAFRPDLQSIPTVHLGRVWVGDIVDTASLLHLYVILSRVHHWMKDDYRRTIETLIRRAKHVH